MYPVLKLFVLVFVFVQLAIVPAMAAKVSTGLGGSSLGYSCSTDDLPGDLIPGRSCTCTGGWDSADCKKMLAEVCESNDLDDQFSVCSGKTGGPIDSCSCHWKKTFTTFTMKLQKFSPGSVLAPAN